MLFQATDDQILTMAALAVNAARPMGAGFLNYDPGRTYQANDMRDALDAHGLAVDYCGGRMAKLYLSRTPEGWHAPDSLPRSDYQSWCATYPTYPDLLRAAGIEVPQ